jgi:hypothetical protein
MQNIAYLVGMVGKNGLAAKTGNPFRMGVLLKNFIIKFNSGGREEERCA